MRNDPPGRLGSLRQAYEGQVDLPLHNPVLLKHSRKRESMISRPLPTFHPKPLCASVVKNAIHSPVSCRRDAEIFFLNSNFRFSNPEFTIHNPKSFQPLLKLKRQSRHPVRLIET